MKTISNDNNRIRRTDQSAPALRLQDVMSMAQREQSLALIRCFTKWRRAKPARGREHAMTRFPLATSRSYSRKWRHKHGGAAEVNLISKDELAVLSKDVCLSPADLRSLATRDLHSADLLRRRISGLGLELQALDPRLRRDMERLCTFCQSKGRCKRDLAQGMPAWPSYCPNNYSLRTVVAKGGDANFVNLVA